MRSSSAITPPVVAAAVEEAVANTAARKPCNGNTGALFTRWHITFLFQPVAVPAPAVAAVSAEQAPAASPPRPPSSSAPPVSEMK